jgi:hypothetical protein
MNKIKRTKGHTLIYKTASLAVMRITEISCVGLKYVVDIIRAFSNILTNVIMRSLLFPYSNAEHVTSILTIFVNKKPEPVFVNINATSIIMYTLYYTYQDRKVLIRSRNSKK